MYHTQNYSLIDGLGQRKYLNALERRNFLKSINILDQEKSLFVLIIYWAGVRISEALNICPEHIDIEEGVVTVRSLKKRGKIKYRQVPLPPFYLKKLSEYLGLLEFGKPIWKFSKRSGVRYVKKVMNKAGIKGSRACSRGLRHSYAINCILNQVPLPLIQKYLGHSSITVTVIYTQIMGADEKKLIEKTWRQ